MPPFLANFGLRGSQVFPPRAPTTNPSKRGGISMILPRAFPPTISAFNLRLLISKKKKEYTHTDGVWIRESHLSVTKFYIACQSCHAYFSLTTPIKEELSFFSKKKKEKLKRVKTNSIKSWNLKNLKPKEAKILKLLTINIMG